MTEKGSNRRLTSLQIRAMLEFPERQPGIVKVLDGEGKMKYYIDPFTREKIYPEGGDKNEPQATGSKESK